MKHCYLQLFFALCGASICTNALGGPIDQPMAKLAAEIKAFIEDANLQKEIIVGQFPGVPSMKATGGVEIKRSLAEQLEAIGIGVTDDAPLSVMGRFKEALSKNQKYVVRIEAQLLDGSANELVEFVSQIEGTPALVIAGRTGGSSPIDKIKKDISEIIGVGTKSPDTVIQKSPESKSSVIRPTPSSPFGMEILIRDEDTFKPINAKIKERRRAYVELHDGVEYLVKFYNDEDFEVAADLTIDGVHTFELADDVGFKNSKFLVPPKSTRMAKGWFRNKSKASAFLIGGYEGSVAQQQGISFNEVGVITATFQAAWKTGDRPPISEPLPNVGLPDSRPQAPAPQDPKPLTPLMPSDDGETVNIDRIFTKKESNPLTSMLGDGMNAFYSGKKEEAFKLFTAVIDRGLPDPRAYYFRGMIAFDQQDIDEAVRDWVTGAGIEADSKKDFQIGRSLQRFQGEGRIRLERIRRDARDENVNPLGGTTGKQNAAADGKGNRRSDGRLRAEVRAKLKEANQLLRTDPIGVAGALKSLLGKIKASPDISPEVRVELSSQVRASIEIVNRLDIDPFSELNLHARMQGASAFGSAATAAGRVIDVESRSVNREYGVSRAIISVRYSKSLN